MFLKIIDKSNNDFGMAIISYESISAIGIQSISILDGETSHYEYDIGIWSKFGGCFKKIRQKTLEDAVTLANELQQKLEKLEKCIIEVE